MTRIITIIDQALAGEVICDIGQIDNPTRNALNRLVRAGVLARWRGHWFPVTGAQDGIGPLKTCWGKQKP